MNIPGDKKNDVPVIKVAVLYKKPQTNDDKGKALIAACKKISQEELPSNKVQFFVWNHL